MRRVLVTGSRYLTDGSQVWDALDAQVEQYGEIIVIEGGAPGADQAAAAYAFSHDVYHEQYPADWERECDARCYHKPRTKNGRHYCPMAGHLRNQKMIDLGADVCLAFPMRDSRGTRDCMKRAEAAGIPVIKHEVSQ